MRTDLDASTADAGIPANRPEYARGYEDAPADSQRSCAVAFMGMHTETDPVDETHFKALIGELRERDWQQPRQQENSYANDGALASAQVVLKQRGWTVVARYQLASAGGGITLTALDEACMKKHDADADPLA
ncbi:hypothetical protein [Streptomyces minutiscleroticus]|uniref:hypothetical protein n=1 Tax=Streptomyces minutiscleroticus TaxID=68238 RepID=UPI00167DC25F|nr:hypothetical protein [Streptomyces minutiscleroticus]